MTASRLQPLLLGAHELERDPEGPFLWSTRTLRLFVDVREVPRVRIGVRAQRPETIAVALDGEASTTAQLGGGEGVLEVAIPAERSARPVMTLVEVRCELAATWRAPGDPRDLGVQVRWVELETTSGVERVQADRLGRPDPMLHGGHQPERDPDGPFVWSRREVSFFVDVRGVREVRLGVRAVAAVGVTLSVDGDAPTRSAIEAGEGVLGFAIPARGSQERAVVELRVRLDETWRSPGDPRNLGVRLCWLELVTAAGEERIAADRFSRNPRSGVVRWPDAAFVHHPDPDADRAATRRRENLAANVRERDPAEGLPAAAEVASTPLKLYLEVAWFCSLRCPSCFHAYIPPAAKKQEVHFMSPLLFERLVERLFPGALLVWFSGNGESLLHPSIGAMLATAAEFDFVPALLTSGNFFDERTMAALVDGGFQLSVSVDSPVAGDFERLRSGARFARVAGGLERLAELARARPGTGFAMRVQAVAQRSNIEQLADLVRWSADRDVQEVQFLPLHAFGLGPAVEAERLQHLSAVANERMLDALSAGTERRVRVRAFPPIAPTPAMASLFAEAIEENLSFGIPSDEVWSRIHGLAEHPANRPDHVCHLPWSEAFIGADGKLAPCDMYLDHLTIGNLYDADFDELWNGEAMRTMRAHVNGPSPTGMCAHGTCMFRPNPRSG